ncbi:hypothetical protein MHAS_02367 [Mycolicibacterium hassiacum DSM 44199]|nr:membrane protein [Mycolicibacterium hassiacum DSM 44199]VCT90658.1 hypothetical protein MHAS_02367 [Mycolicibacterium hassiacum DSM 44199]
MRPMSEDFGNDEFARYKDDIDAAERRVAREIDPGARAVVIAVGVFVLLASFALPHAGGAQGWEALLGGPDADQAGIALPHRVFMWLALVFGVGFSMLALLLRRWEVAWIALAGSMVASMVGVLAVWTRQTAPDPYPGLGIGLIVAWLAVMFITYHWSRAVWVRTALQLAVEEERRRRAADQQQRKLLDDLPERPDEADRRDDTPDT